MKRLIFLFVLCLLVGSAALPAHAATKAAKSQPTSRIIVSKDKKFSLTLYGKDVKKKISIKHMAGGENALASYQLLPRGTKLSQPATVTFTIPTQSSDFPLLLHKSGSSLEVVDKTTATHANGYLTLRASISHFSNLHLVKGIFSVQIADAYDPVLVGKTREHQYIVTHPKETTQTYRLAGEKITNKIEVFNTGLSGELRNHLGHSPHIYPFAPDSTSITEGFFLEKKPFRCVENKNDSIITKIYFSYAISIDGSKPTHESAVFEKWTKAPCISPTFEHKKPVVQCTGNVVLSGDINSHQSSVKSITATFFGKKHKTMPQAAGVINEEFGQYTITTQLPPDDTYEYRLWIELEDAPSTIKVHEGTFTIPPCPQPIVDSKIEKGEKTTLKALKIHDLHIKFIDTRTATGDHCEGEHYHSATGPSVTTIEGKILPDNDGCGYGLVKQVPIVEIDVAQ
ncbi:hypothetical protein HY620_02465 [Candidatus Uhrbacteria bacterium]|nr:hypothetical protein [Candidatus Uhrbacteria bacterium]